MKKIPTIFVRDLSKQPALVTPMWQSGCEWVRDGAGFATLKHDSTCCLIRRPACLVGRAVDRRRGVASRRWPRREIKRRDFRLPW